MKTFTDALAPANRRSTTQTKLERRTLNGATMGTRYSAVFYADPEFETAVLSAALFDAVDRVDQQMSTWNPQSDLNQLNAIAIGEWLTLPPELMTVLHAGLDVERKTNGAFDIGVGALVQAWGFGPSDLSAPDHSHSAISLSKLANRPVTREALTLDMARGRAKKGAPMSLDLSGIAKGFAVDEMARVMANSAIPSWLVGIDGEMRGQGLKPDRSTWAVAHERPDRQIRDAMGVIELTDMAVATSGNYRHWRTVNGEFVSHTIDPRTNAPLQNDIASVTVIAPTCMAADAWATALMVLGPDAALDTAKRFKMNVIIVLGSGTVMSTV